ncbi:MAG: hypothetical protein HY921_04085 [Elusimicrobia bacterium]|nr:hypothetical protein [Elusimicrobiota bacterium]
MKHLHHALLATLVSLAMPSFSAQGPQPQGKNPVRIASIEMAVGAATDAGKNAEAKAPAQPIRSLTGHHLLRPLSNFVFRIFRPRAMEPESSVTREELKRLAAAVADAANPFDGGRGHKLEEMTLQTADRLVERGATPRQIAYFHSLIDQRRKGRDSVLAIQ